jgi:hypothetical protein
MTIIECDLCNRAIDRDAETFIHVAVWGPPYVSKELCLACARPILTLLEIDASQKGKHHQ